MLNNSETITVSSTLTKVGKKRLTEGNFDIKKVSFSDDGVNYALINGNLSDSDILIKRSPMLDVWENAHLSMKNRIHVESEDKVIPNNVKNFDLMVSDSGIFSDDGDQRFPVVEKNDGFHLKYEGYDGIELSNPSTNKLSFNYRSMYGIDGFRFITATLFDSSYFDIALTDENLNSYLNPFDISYLSDDEIENVIAGVEHNKNFFDAIQRQQVNGYLNMSASERNFITSFLIDPNSSDDLPKTINVGIVPYTGTLNSFSIYYKGNFEYQNAGTQNYVTYIELLDEISGLTEYIKLSITPKS